MIDPTTLATYSLIVLGFVFIPGPATLLTVARATTSGTRVGIATGAGVTTGDLVHTLMAVIGISAIIAASATLFSLIKYLGAAYLIYLGIRTLFDKTPVDLSQGRLPITAGQAFNQAILAEVLNPKTALFFLAFLPQFVVPEAGNIALQLTLLGLIYASLGFLATIVWAVGAGALGAILRRKPALVRWQSRVVGSIYCSLGLRIALQER